MSDRSPLEAKVCDLPWNPPGALWRLKAPTPRSGGDSAEMPQDTLLKHLPAIQTRPRKPNDGDSCPRGRACTPRMGYVPQEYGVLRDSL
jgi:hypothetical protein